MPPKGEPPNVTGISPSEGPPGTIVKIRGENLGNDQADLLGIFIGNVNCTYTAEWHKHYISCRTGMGLGNGDIIVFTKSGGMGTSLVKFKGYMPRVGLLTEAAVWVDESKLFEEKPSATLSNSRQYTQSSIHSDPLGVASEDTGAVLPADKIEEWYPSGSSNPHSDKFHPARFLLERHLDTSFEALKMGYLHLQSQDTRKSVGPSSFVRGNLNTILDSLETLGSVYKQMTIDESNSVAGNICQELQGVLQSCDLASNNLFKDIIARKDEADSKRNVLNILQRFRFLFSLPKSIERNIKQGDYEILISDYNRAKALFQNTEVKSFQQALSEVEQKVSVFMEQLKMKLFQYPLALEEQKKMIRYLNDLDYVGNAGWECIEKQCAWIKQNFDEAKVHYEGSKSNTLSSPPPELNENPLIRPLVLPDTLKRYDSTDILQGSSKPKGILLVEELSEIITENLPDLWYLGQAYVANQLGQKIDKANTLQEDKEKFQFMVKDLITTFCSIVEGVIRPGKASTLMSGGAKVKMLIPWLPETVRTIRSTLEKLMKIGLGPDIIAPLKSLSTIACSDCIKKVLQSTVNDISMLNRKEDWQLDYSEEGDYVSKLPSLFEKKVNDSLKFVIEFMASSKIDTKNESRVLHEEVGLLLKDMLEVFLIALEKTAFPEDLPTDEMSIAMEEIPSQMAKDELVLIVLSNCNHLKTKTFPKVIESCCNAGYTNIADLQDEIMSTLDKLDEQVFQKYIEMKGDSLVGSIEMGMTRGEFRWDSNLKSSGVRQYVHDTLTKLVVIHNQISAVSLRFSERILTRLCEVLVDEMKRIFECLPGLSPAGNLQAQLDLNAFKYALRSYLTQDAIGNIDSTLKQLPALKKKEQKNMDSLFESFKSKMRYQLASLLPANDDVAEEEVSKPKSAPRERKSSKSEKKLKSKPSIDQSWGADIEIVKETSIKRTAPQPIPSKASDTDGLAPNSTTSKGSSPSISPGDNKKRRAPPPPKGQDKSELQTEHNPFLDDDDEEEE